jgi:NTP pyrophosphatase (non-canonical NTP hydrolase)
VFFSLVCIANTTGVNLETSLESVLKKYQARLADRGEAGSGR